jgi:hypothetical protein
LLGSHVQISREFFGVHLYELGVHPETTCSRFDLNFDRAMQNWLSIWHACWFSPKAISECFLICPPSFLFGLMKSITNNSTLRSSYDFNQYPHPLTAQVEFS